ncbi:MAG: hypothetical protein EOO08_03590 [Chitinophagaceae bacterium]|nr:MAG: hypothetical protein EOO08_03590 [Chitinophagaceae bacterium]
MPLSRRKRWFLWGLSIFAFLMVLLAVAAERYVEPALRKRIGVLIVQGSDSLYNWRMGKLDVSLFGGHVAIEGLHIEVDSNQYRVLLAEKRLPPLTMNVDMPYGHLRGIDVFNLLLGRNVRIGELVTEGAHIEVWRNGREQRQNWNRPPLWKMIRPNINSIVLKRLKLEGVRFGYRHADDSGDVQLKFDTCSALVRDIRIDSAASVDPERIGFCRYVKLHFYDLKFRSADSSMKLKARTIDYSSEDKLLSIRDFKMQPTLKDKESFYEGADKQREMTVIEFAQLDLTKFRMEEFVRNNAVMADSLLVDTPSIRIYTDKTLPPTLEGKMGRYPQQLLMHARTDIHIKGIALRDANLTYTERSEKSGQEGTLALNHLNITVSNVTNIKTEIMRDSTCRLEANGNILGTSPLRATFLFFLNEPEGRFQCNGTIANVQASQLNGLAEPLAGIRMQSLDLQELRFRLEGNDYTARGEVGMRYRNLYLVLQKEDEETGLLKTKKLLTKLVNKYTLLHENPAPDGYEAVARNVERSRLMTQTFFGLVWKTIFSGMQTIMTNTAD